MVSRKHFKVLADALKEQQPMHDPSHAAAVTALQIKQWERDVHAVAKALNTFNPRFDYSRFVEACGINQEAAA